MAEGRRGGTPHRGPTQAEVAAHAQVSAQTVSRVVNDQANVDASTRERVLNSMRELGYRRNRSAVALRTGEHGTIGVLLFALSTYGNVRTWESLTLAADHRGYSVAVITVEKATPETLLDAFTRLTEQSVDGIVLLEERFFAEVRLPVPAGLPVVVIDAGVRGEFPVVDTDQAQGAELATEHLLGLGHPTVWHLAGPEGSFLSAKRADAWRQTLERAGREVPPVISGDWTSRSGYEAGLLLRERRDVSAVFAANDQMALGLLRAFHERGIAVPEQVSVVGFDDTPESSSYWPPLTTIHQDFASVGQAGVDVLLAALRGEVVPPATIIPTRLVVRASTAPYHPR